MSAVAAIESMLLAAIAALHAAWGGGVVWPRQNEEDLVRLVVGYRREQMPPPGHCFAAAGAILAAALIVGLLAGQSVSPLPPTMLTVLGIGVTAVFAGRGVAGYLPVWRARFPREPFARLDRLVYSPLCLLIALTCAYLLVERMER